MQAICHVVESLPVMPQCGLTHHLHSGNRREHPDAGNQNG
ncbi:hypothetical protein RISK_004133 [Rhodopirellula islandica]|uniref:Uncharacterized protein n=1 Tax=Rhodopirellula islandica TaxID=595434 RepID=A0A0J1BB40_RHOIS|nr:hypothetical protein RISK_004133 [Rhodopirellula islandica]